MIEVFQTEMGKVITGLLEVYGHQRYQSIIYSI